MNLNDLLDEQLNNHKYQEPENLIEKSTNNLIKNIEAEYTGYDSVELDRKKEIKELDAKIIKLTRELNSIRPQKGLSGSVQKRAQNSELMNKKREKLRKEIKELKFKLEEIMAEGGDDNSPQSILDSLKKDKKGNHVIEIQQKPEKITENKTSTINLSSNPYLDV